MKPNKIYSSIFCFLLQVLSELLEPSPLARLRPHRLTLVPPDLSNRRKTRAK